MGKTVNIIAGLVIASGIAYQLKYDVQKDPRRFTYHTPIGDELERETDIVQTKLEHSHDYFRHRFAPSVKAAWNEQVTNFTHKLIDSNLPTKAKDFWNEHVLGHA
ncbi:hypothetical protein DM01DRAFT_1339412 [Hesseltinella vesiculosa]|uniref:Uncharacterized protein n=1 Tax=Hesseltinella vesiculosa TaxID=101127 RepID=A0A1X2G702_9FUNG|nr:hypothetical protein DM01DRAFT_1339412 [Hesseltinella vesiculosa]